MSEDKKQLPTLPVCPKCKKIPLKCPYPKDCGMENL